MFTEAFEALCKDRLALSIKAAQYQTHSPFPHIVLNDVIEPGWLHTLHNDFPEPDPSWWKYDNVLERKYAKDDIASLPITLKTAAQHLISKKFTDFLEDLTGISGLVIDQHFRGGGLHQIARGGNLTYTSIIISTPI